MHQVAAGLEYVHHKGFLHCDIACRNVLVSPSGVLKISDFGLARKIGSEECNLKGTKAKFPIRWTAPEVFVHQQLSAASDVWSFGVLFWEVVTLGDIPFATLTNKEAKRAVKRGHHPEKPPNCRQEFYQVMKQCWNQDPEERPAFTDVVQELLSLKIKLAHQQLNTAEVKEINIKKKTPKFHWPRKRKTSHSEVPEEPVVNDCITGPDASVPGLIRIKTLLINQDKMHVVLKASYSTKASKLISAALKKTGIDEGLADKFCLVEVGHNGVYQRVLDEDEYPLSLTASPFYSSMQEIYICRYDQAFNIHASIRQQQAREEENYRDAVERTQQQRTRPRPKVDMAGIGDDDDDDSDNSQRNSRYEDEPGATGASSSSSSRKPRGSADIDAGVGGDGARMHEDTEDEDEFDTEKQPWFKRKKGEFGRRTVKMNMKSAVYEGTGASSAGDNAGKRVPGLSEALYEEHTDHDGDERDDETSHASHHRRRSREHLGAQMMQEAQQQHHHQHQREICKRDSGRSTMPAGNASDAPSAAGSDVTIALKDDDNAQTHHLDATHSSGDENGQQHTTATATTAGIENDKEPCIADVRQRLTEMMQRDGVAPGQRPPKPKPRPRPRTRPSQDNLQLQNGESEDVLGESTVRNVPEARDHDHGHHTARASHEHPPRPQRKRSDPTMQGPVPQRPAVRQRAPPPPHNRDRSREDILAAAGGSATKLHITRETTSKRSSAGSSIGGDSEQDYDNHHNRRRHNRHQQHDPHHSIIATSAPSAASWRHSVGDMNSGASTVSGSSSNRSSRDCTEHSRHASQRKGANVRSMAEAWRQRTPQGSNRDSLHETQLDARQVPLPALPSKLRLLSSSASDADGAGDSNDGGSNTGSDAAGPPRSATSAHSTISGHGHACRQDEGGAGEDGDGNSRSQRHHGRRRAPPPPPPVSPKPSRAAKTAHATAAAATTARGTDRERRRRPVPPLKLDKQGLGGSLSGSASSSNSSLATSPLSPVRNMEGRSRSSSRSSRRRSTLITIREDQQLALSEPDVEQCIADLHRRCSLGSNGRASYGHVHMQPTLRFPPPPPVVVPSPTGPVRRGSCDESSASYGSIHDLRKPPSTPSSASSSAGSGSDASTGGSVAAPKDPASMDDLDRLNLLMMMSLDEDDDEDDFDDDNDDGDDDDDDDDNATCTEGLRSDRARESGEATPAFNFDDDDDDGDDDDDDDDDDGYAHELETVSAKPTRLLEAVARLSSDGLMRGAGTRATAGRGSSSSSRHRRSTLSEESDNRSDGGYIDIEVQNDGTLKKKTRRSSSHRRAFVLDNDNSELAL
ncbi:serine/threonine protein kinase [Salpingoeca rosetta]|uniref:Serine/threonine protein kinase n=1 Tax=Salpingoeca rosetta (strain ATCC 50818 / BSB-021) TaxID=946362 RepID=F2U7T6_SALR5|nr:serine/threonine protein kinase [Salpingoeca rosetta]EGD72841.1 serine/threonine protein kinase [Salpingoeca rosetta]|eukprot:XP_004994664.1 serine/threonine protein kinase [Salpingoeca rosetta]